MYICNPRYGFSITMHVKRIRYRSHNTQKKNNQVYICLNFMFLSRGLCMHI